jgi:hypothetical protein
MSEGKTVIEIGGLKLEVDMRSARRIDEMRVGDRVQVLHKPSYGGPSIFPGMIIGFKPFKTLPSIQVAYITSSFNSAEIKFATLNSESKDFEIIKSVDDDGLEIDRDKLLKTFAMQIATKQKEIEEIELRRDYFLRNFRAYWEPVETTVTA